MTNIEKEQEIWKTYPEYPFLQVSNLGRVKTIDHYVPGKNGSKRLVKGRILKQHRNSDGYMRISTRVSGKNINLSVHRMVAICFIPNPNNYPEVNHKDNDPTNNAVSNLEWCDRQYNFAYKEKYGKSAAEVFGRPVFAVDLKTGKVLRFESQSEAARKLGVNVGHINRVVKGKLYQTGGYWFTEDESEITEKKIQEIKANMQPCPVIAVNLDTFEVLYFKSQHEAERKLGIRNSNINSVVKGYYNKTHGYWFTYVDENAVEKTRSKFGDELAEKVEKLISNKFLKKVDINDKR